MSASRLRAIALRPSLRGTGHRRGSEAEYGRHNGLLAACEPVVDIRRNIWRGSYF